MTQYRRGQRVRYVGLLARADRPVGVVRAVTTAGLRIRWADGRTELVHPDDVWPVTP